MLSLKMMATALLLPWRTALQYASVAIGLLLYCSFAFARLQLEPAPVSLHQWLGPLIAGALSLVGITILNRVRRDLFLRNAALAESGARLRLLLDSSPEGVVVLRDRRIIFSNDRFVSLLGSAAANDVIGRCLLDLVSPRGRRAVADCLDAAVEAGTNAAALDATLVKADATVLDATLTAAPLWYKGQPALQVTIRDITERKRAEEEKAALLHAQQEEAEIAAALAQMGREMVSSLDTPVLLDRLCAVSAQVLECDTSTTLLWVPAEGMYQLAASYGLTEEERKIAQVVKVPPGAASTLLSRLEQDDVAQVGTIPKEVVSVRQQEQVGVTLPLCMALRRGGEIIGLQVATWRFRVDPYTSRQLRIAQGIAQVASLALENARLATEAKEASRLKSEFVATISHELRTPLNVIMGYIALMLDGEFGPLTADQMSTLRDVSKNSEDLLQLIAVTLDLSRLERGQVQVEVRETDVSVLLREISDETQGYREKPEVSFHYHMAPELPLLYTDPGKLKVVLKNLIANAVKFTEHGSVSVEAHVFNGGVEFGVTDTGIGIAPEDLPVIFEPFRQADGTQTRRNKGVGLGLNIVRRLLDLLSGQITVDSEVGRGSTFRVWIPRSSTTCRPPVDPGY